MFENVGKISNAVLLTTQQVLSLGFSSFGTDHYPVMSIITGLLLLLLDNEAERILALFN